MVFVVEVASAEERRRTAIDLVYTAIGTWGMNSSKVGMVNILDAAIAQPLWAGGTLEANLLSVANIRSEMGRGPVITEPGIVGSLEVGSIPLSLFKFGIEQAAGRTRSFVGVRNIHSDYFITPWNSIFTASVNGLLPTLSRQMPFASTPAAAFGLHFEWDITRWGLSYKSSLYNGWASTRWDEVFRFRPRRDGIVCLSELAMEGRAGTYVGTYKLGAATGRVRSRDDSDRSYNGSYWALIEQPIYIQADGAAIALILRGGYASKNEWQGYWGAGAVWQGVFDRGTDYLGMLVTREWRRTGCQTAYEVSYAYRWHFLTLQPTLHWVHTPARDHWYTTLRLALAFNN